MPMPKLDPARFVHVMPVDPFHRVPMAAPGRFFSQDPANPDLADLFDPYVAQLLAGGSLRRACDVETANAKAAVKAAADKAAADKEEAEKAAADAAKAAAAEENPVTAAPSSPAAPTAEAPPAEPVAPPATETTAADPHAA